ncbi:MAG: flagellar biosynthesis protein FlhB [Blastocatellia bacterium]|nr:flagellar biosynthesis protein FlhB [Blastocatellia bacterium]
MASDRTEKATPKRREVAREKGQVARRPELAAAASFLAALIMLRVDADQLLHRSAKLFQDANGYIVTREPLTIPALQGMFVTAGANLAMLCLPVIAAAMAAGVAGNFAQGGLTFAPKALMPKAERFNPVANVKRVFGGNSVVELLKSLIKLGGLTIACYGVLVRTIAESPKLIGAPSPRVFLSLGSLIYALGLRAGGVLLLVAVLDYFYGWYKHEKSLRMTKQEMKDEMRKQEGDPMIKNQRRRAARALAQRRIASEVPRADVVVTNPTHFAVALKYDRERDAAPTVVAKGADLMAKRIREIAAEHDVTIVENPPLARSLYATVEVGGTIPAELFRAVAELLAYIYKQREPTKR